MKVLVLGGGVVGVATAYHLLKDGYEVTVIDRQPPALGGASYGNAGLITTGHAYAWASPKALKTLLLSFFRKDPTFKIKLPPDPQLVRWGLKFLQECNDASVRRNTIAKHRLCMFSQHVQGLMIEQTGIRYHRKNKGLLYLYRTSEALETGAASIKILQDDGQVLEVVDTQRVFEIDPTLKHMQDRIVGAIFSPLDESGSSWLFTENLLKVCLKMGGTFESGTTIERLEVFGDSIQQVVTNRGSRTADLYVLCLGSWSPLLVRDLGIKLHVYPVKGYSVTIPVEEGCIPPFIGGIDEERKLAYAPIGDQVRLTSVAEFTGYDTKHTPKDFEYLLQTARDLLPNAGNYSKAEHWAGLRPMTPDSLPVLGKARHHNLYYNTGHGHMGWSMACGTAFLTADLISGRTPEIPVENFRLR